MVSTAPIIRRRYRRKFVGRAFEPLQLTSYILGHDFWNAIGSSQWLEENKNDSLLKTLE
jgi:hypothetical protein